MNDEPLPPDHGYPVRVIVPGYAAVRSVKWLERIELAHEEAEGPWQRGLNYKILPPSVTDARHVDLSKMPPVMELSVFSGITGMELADTPQAGKNSTMTPTLTGQYTEGDIVPVLVSGWAYAGGGRSIGRVDVTGDDGKEWHTAELTAGAHQRPGRSWAWVFWDCTIPGRVVQDEQGKPVIRVASKAMDMALNVQPESCQHTWNVRGLGNNSWYRSQLEVPLQEPLLPAGRRSAAQHIDHHRYGGGAAFEYIDGI